MSLATVVQHLRVLQDAGLVRSDHTTTDYTTTDHEE
ncbi:ArsR family transcriptional regulator [Nocardia sp. BMG51109]|nr:ArsR family transcriptional regulator [Nocardia sp. BMG51109]